jgi:hypothetical protein
MNVACAHQPMSKFHRLSYSLRLVGINALGSVRKLFVEPAAEGRKAKNSYSAFAGFSHHGTLINLPTGRMVSLPIKGARVSAAE